MKFRNNKIHYLHSDYPKFTACIDLEQYQKTKAANIIPLPLHVTKIDECSNKDLNKAIMKAQKEIHHYLTAENIIYQEPE